MRINKMIDRTTSFSTTYKHFDRDTLRFRQNGWKIVSVDERVNKLWITAVYVGAAEKKRSLRQMMADKTSVKWQEG